METIDVIRTGFDNLDVAFQGNISSELADVLQAAKEQATETKSLVPIEYRGQKMLVLEGGARGGYSFKCDTGPLGAVWFFKKLNSSDAWGVRVSVKAFALALFDLGGVRSQIYDFLDAIGIDLPAGAESISRIDFAVDVLMPGFALQPDNFVFHSRMVRAEHEDLNHRDRRGTSGKVTSVRIGTMPGRQVVIYDKRKEVIQTRKPVWWEIWNAARARDGKPLLDPTDKDASQVWRVELRAGKHCLKEKWKIRTWSDLDNRLADLFKRLIEDVRYTLSIDDGNRSRWPNHALWDAVRQRVETELWEMGAGLDPERAKEVIREEHASMLERQVRGLSATVATLRGYDPARAREVPDLIAKGLRNFQRFNPGDFEERMERAGERYIFIEKPKAPGGV